MKMTLPFGPWVPDRAEHGLEYLRVCENLLPTASGYRSIYAPQPAGGHDPTLSLSAIHAHIVSQLGTVDSSGDQAMVDTAFLLTGSRDALFFEGTKVSPAGGYSNTDGIAFDGWSFLSWGNTILASSYAYPIQRQQYPDSPLFEDCITSEAKPQGKIVRALGNHVVLLNIYLPEEFEAVAQGHNPQLVWWSKTDNERSFGGAEDFGNTGYQALVDVPGAIQAAVNVGDDTLMIFKQHGVHTMYRTGGPGLYGFNTAFYGHGVGTVYPESIVVSGGDVYFWNSHGIPVVSRGLGVPEPIGDGVVSDWLSDREFGRDHAFAAGRTEFDESGQPVIDTYLHQVYGALDAATGTVLWIYAPFSEPARPFRYLAYSTRTGAFASGDLGDLQVAGMASRLRSNGYSQHFGASKAFPATLVMVDRLSRLVYEFGSRFGSEKFDDGSGGQDQSVLPWRIVTGAGNLVQPSGRSTGFGIAEVQAIRPILRLASNESPRGQMPAITIRAADNPHMLDACEVVMDPWQGYVVTDGLWYSVPGGALSGEYFEFEFRGQPAKNSLLTELVGFQLDAVPAGDVR